jgi:excisionase family DNA binding protein
MSPGPADGRPPPDTLSLQEAADRLGVHYMTAYRHVRTGRLPARRHDGRWHVTEADLAAFQEPGSPGRLRAPDRAAAPAEATGSRWAAGLERHRDRLLDRLLAGDERGAWKVVEDALVARTTPDHAHLDLLAPCLAEVGRRWEDGRLTVGDEHVASATASRVAARLAPLAIRPGRRRGTVVLGGAPGEQHGLPLTLLTNVLRARGWQVLELGANTPVDDFVAAAGRADRLTAVGVSVGSATTTSTAARVLAALRKALPDVPLLAGGPGLTDHHTAHTLGADAWAPDADATAELLTDLRR